MHRRRTSVLAVLATVLAGCSTQPSPVAETVRALDQMEREVEASIPEPGRAREATHLLEQMKREAGRFFDRYAGTRDDLLATNADYYATDADVQVVFDRIHAARAAATESLITLFVSLKKVAKPAEWAAITERMSAGSARGRSTFFRVITTLWILFGASPDDPDSMVSRLARLQFRVPDAVPDQSRAAKVTAVLAEMKRAVALFHTEVGLVRAQLIPADADYAAGADVYRAIFRELDAAWIHAETRFLQLRSELRGLITRTEWKNLYADQRRTVR